MKTFQLLAVLFISALLSFSCKTNTGDSPKDLVEAPVKVWADDELRDIPGMTAKRGLINKTDGATPGYVIFHPSTGTSTYLMNLDGEIVHEWKGELNSLVSYLIPNGNIIRPARDPDFPTFAAGGQSGRIQEWTWDGEKVWDFKYATKDKLTHHDIAVMPNGNILAIAYEVKTAEEVIAAGRNPEHTPKAGLWPDVIIEIEPTKPEGGNIVWEWHLWDHLIQDQDASKQNYGVISENPRRININAGHPPPPITQEQLEGMKAQKFLTSNATVDNQGSDITHMNSIFYNEEKDQIAVSVPGFNEMFIIDHSTTTEEAKGSTGGKWGHGGDLLYRWGNPYNYGRGSEKDQRLFFEHDVRWIPEGMRLGGKIMVFNNDRPSTTRSSKFPNAFAAMGALQDINISIGDLAHHSEVVVFTPPTNRDGSYVLPENGPFGPEDIDWNYIAKDTFSFYGPFISSVHMLQSGNVFINSGPRGRFMEVTPDGNIVWEYLNPYVHDYTLPDGSPPQPAGPFIFGQFRVTHIAPDHPGLAGRDLSPIDPQPAPFVPGPPPSNGGN